MRAQYVYESMSFDRDIDPKKSLKIGSWRKMPPPDDLRELVDGEYVAYTDWTGFRFRVDRNSRPIITRGANYILDNTNNHNASWNGGVENMNRKALDKLFSDDYEFYIKPRRYTKSTPEEIFLIMNKDFHEDGKVKYIQRLR